jgi:hypothetical protein
VIGERREKRHGKERKTTEARRKRAKPSTPPRLRVSPLLPGGFEMVSKDDRDCSSYYHLFLPLLFVSFVVPLSPFLLRASVVFFPFSSLLL